MKTRLSWFTTTLAVACVAGAALIVFFVFGYYSLGALLWSAVIGLALGVPLGLWASKRIKRRDPDWPPQDGLRKDAPAATRGPNGL
ncbi:hypothetical protein [Pseudooceanicola sp.]|jgi:ABC-type proline/glycine betaine transport system permease subunit|uniref:hypothetical protein n=1 Tax=Pseudooceanicola sp. TaxID=1914328 RepID=UPI0035168607